MVAGIATTPLLALHFETVPLVSIPANLAALPAVAPVMWSGMIDDGRRPACRTRDHPGGRGRSAAALGLWRRKPLLAWLEVVATTRSRSSYPPSSPSACPGRSPRWRLRYSGSASPDGRRCARRAAPFADELRARARVARARPDGRGTQARPSSSSRDPSSAPAPPDGLTVSFLDVGQGDATLIQHPDGSAVLFDGGRAGGARGASLRRAGVRRLSAVVATHASADHHGGLAEVLQPVPVDLLLDGGDGTRDPTFAALLATPALAACRSSPRAPARAAGGRARNPRAVADPGRPGPLRRTRTRARSSRSSAAAPSSSCCPPTPRARRSRASTCRMSTRSRCPHHGSADPGLAAVLERLRPEVAVIEVGENSYGHPHPDTLATLERAVPTSCGPTATGPCGWSSRTAGCSLE